jgi:Chaperone of endosialidase
MKTTDIKLIGQSPLRLGFLLIALALACFCLLPGARATDLGGVLPGSNNADGLGVLTSLTTGGLNTGCGWLSLTSDQAGSWNTAYGAATLYHNTGGQDNTALGAGALFHNTDGMDNTANGLFALFNNLRGRFNTAIGVEALSNNFDGDENTAIGVNALTSSTYGFRNTATGADALYSNLDGSYNTADGYRALYNHVGALGGYNTAIGAGALYNDTSGGGNVAVGLNAGFGVTTANNVICIGTGIQGANVSDSCFIGNIFGVQVGLPDALPVVVDTLGQLGTAASSQRLKRDIKPMDKASKAILSLKPVTFHYKNTTKNTLQFGLVAEDVAKVNPDLVMRDKNGEIYTVRYDAVNAMLLNEFLKEHRKVQELETTVAQQQQSFQSRLAEQERQIEALASGLQRVSAQLQMSKLKPQVIARNGREHSVPLSAQHFTNQN